MEPVDCFDEGATMTDLSALMECMMRFFQKQKWIEHSAKVFAYAVGIGDGERLSRDEMTILGASALLHDIGIPSAKERYGDSAGEHQEAESARLAPELMRKAGVPERYWERVAWLVGHHHTEHLAGDDQLLQMLMEADYLVNLVEGNVKDRSPREVYDGFFRTATGKRYLAALFKF